MRGPQNLLSIFLSFFVISSPFHSIIAAKCTFGKVSDIDINSFSLDIYAFDD